jgi:hypothetical protein
MPQFYIMCGYHDAPPAAVMDMFGRVEYFESRAEAEENAEMLRTYGRHWPPPTYTVVEDTGKPQDGQRAPEAPAYRDQLGAVPVGTPEAPVPRVVALQMQQALRDIMADWLSVPEDAQVPDEINVTEHWRAVLEAVITGEKAGL